MKLRVTLFLQRFFWTFILGTLFAGCTTQNTASFTAMDTFMTIKSNGPKSARANKMAEKRILELESYFSTTREGSDLYTINNSTNQTESTFLVHPETAYLVNYALRMASYTDGRYTPTLYSITKAWGFTRAGGSIADILQQCLPDDLTMTEFADRRVFWPRNVLPADYRDYRVGTDKESRRAIDEIPTEELANAMYEIVVDFTSCDRDVLFRETIRLFGLNKLTEKAQRYLEYALAMLQESGRIN